MIGLMFCNSHGAGVIVAPWGGTRPRLGTNPLAAALPLSPRSAQGERNAMVLDMTTSVVAEGKVRVKRNRGEPTPRGWIIDNKGRPTTDPNDLYGPPRGGILPFGGQSGHKGYGPEHRHRSAEWCPQRGRHHAPAGHSPGQCVPAHRPRHRAVRPRGRVHRQRQRAGALGKIIGVDERFRGDRSARRDRATRSD